MREDAREYKTVVAHISISNAKLTFEHGSACYKSEKKAANQKLRNGQKREGVNDFVTYRYVYFEGEGVSYEIVR